MPEVNLFYQQLEEQCGPDYIKVIRCKDCKEYVTDFWARRGLDETPGFGWCARLRRYVKDCFYCAYGEKGTNE